MPTYEYRCKSCGEHLEVVQSFTDDALTDCPACDAAGQLRKVFGSIGITFKGSGFYKTDSRSGSSKANASSGSDSSSDSTSTSSSDSGPSKSESTKSDSTKSDSKPAASSSSDSKPSTPKPSGSSTSAA